MRRGRAVGRAVLALVVPLFLVEAVLQIGALAVARFVDDPRVAHAVEPRCEVLCVGDSYTFGLGASDRANSYPAALERRLAADARTAGWRVANRGWPGRNSREVLERIEAQLVELHPRHVVVLCGINDLWSRPERFDPDAGAVRLSDADPGFRWRWRLPRLLAILATNRGAFDAEPHDARLPPALIGWWRSGELHLDLRADGTLRFNGAPMRWKTRGDRLVAEPGRGPLLRVRFELRDGRLRIERDPPEPPIEFERLVDAEAVVDVEKEVRSALESGRTDEALEKLSTWLRGSPEDPRARMWLAAASARAGRPDEARAAIEWLERRHAEEPSREVTESLVGALQQTNGSAAALRIASDGIGRFPTSTALMMALATDAEARRDFAEAERLVDQALACSAGDPPDFLGWKLRFRAGVVGRRDPREGLKDLLRFLEVTGDEPRFVQGVQRLPSIEEAMVEPVALGLGWAPERIERARELTRRARELHPAAVLECFTAHLLEIGRICREHGATLLVADYPFPMPALETAQREAARAAGAVQVGIRGAIDRALEVRAREELFVADGHCTDAGYAILAEAVAEAILQAERHRSPGGAGAPRPEESSDPGGGIGPR